MVMNFIFSKILIFLIFSFISKSSSKFICSEQTCPKNRGECIENLCLCAPDYTTFYPKGINNNSELCNYPLKYKKYAICFEMLFPFGIGHFYACRYFNGIIKFVLFWFLSIEKSLFKKKIRRNPELLKVAKICYWLFLLLYTVDFFCFTFNYYLDGNKFPFI